MTESHSDKIVFFFSDCWQAAILSFLPVISSCHQWMSYYMQHYKAAIVLKTQCYEKKKKKHCPNCLCFIVNYPLTHSLNTPSGALNDPLRRGNNGSFELTVLLFGMKICHKSMFGYLQMSTIIYMCTFQNPCVCVCLFFYLARAYGVCLWEVPDAGNQELSGGLLPRQTVCVHSVPG